MDISAAVDRLLEKPLWVIDPMPERVDREHGERFFALEAHWRATGEAEALFGRFLRILQKLGCYYTLDLYCDGQWEAPLHDPAPEMLAQTVSDCARGECGDLTFLLDGGAAAVTLRGDELTLGVYGPDARLRGLCAALAASEGLFWWQADDGTSAAPAEAEKSAPLPTGPAPAAAEKVSPFTADPHLLFWGSAAAIALCALLPLALYLAGSPPSEKLLHSCAGLGFLALLVFFYARALRRPRS